MSRERRVKLIGAPLDLGGGRRGVDMGPSALRIADLGYPVTDPGDVRVPAPETREPGDASKRYVDETARVCRRLCRAISRVMRDDAMPLVLGGDHSVAAGSVSASAIDARRRQRPIEVLWADAHADMNTPATTVSGNVHGMPLAALLGPEPSELSTLVGPGSALTADRVALVGIRSLDRRERERVRESSVAVFTMTDIDRQGIAEVTRQALDRTGRAEADLHLSFDLDVCDPSIAPGVGTRVRGGLSYREAHLLMELVADSGRLRALDVLEINPILDSNNQTAELAVELTLSALGQRIF